MNEAKLPPVGSTVRITSDADGSGSLARGVLATVVQHSTGSYGFVPNVLVELHGGPNTEMRALGLARLDLYDDEYTVEPTDDQNTPPSPY